MHQELLSDPLLKSVPVLKGYKLLEPCVLLGRVGEGGMGVVYRGRHANLDVEVAVKCLLTPGAAKSARGEETIRRFQREARLAAKISHQNVVRVYDVYQRHGVYYLVMEYVRGDTVREWVARRKPLPPAEAMTVALGAARGIAAVHQRGIVHRDINPNNILISIEGEVKVADLGLGGSQEAVDPSDTPFCITQPGAVVGTPIYMPPEQWTGLGNVGPEGDIWALGATLFFLIAGESPFRSPNVQDLMLQICTRPFPDVRKKVPACPAKLAAVVQRCTETDPRRRVKAQELVALLEELERKLGFSCRLEDPQTGLGTTRGRLPVPMPSGLLREAKAYFESSPRGDGLWTPKTERLDFDNFDAAPQEAPPAAPPPLAPPEDADDAPPPAPRPKPRRLPRRRGRARRWWIGASVLVLVALAALAVFLLRDPIADWFEERQANQAIAGARSLLDAGRLEEAEVALDDALALWPEDAALKTAQCDTLRRRIETERNADRRIALAKARKLDRLSGDAKVLIEEIQEEIRSGILLRVTKPARDSSRRVKTRDIDIAGTLAMPSGSVRLSLRGQELRVEDGKFATTVASLEEGRNALVLRAEDAESGVFKEETIDVFVDSQPPEVAITSPPEGAEVEVPFRVEGTARDPSDPILLTLQVGEQKFEADVRDGRWSAEVTRGKPGAELELVATAWDGVTNESEPVRRRVRVERPPQPPPDPNYPPAVPEDFATPGEKNAQGYFEFVHLRSGIRMVYLPPGSFTMGTPDSDPDPKRASEKPAHRVVISKGFFIAKYEVSRDQWVKVMKTLPPRLKRGAGNLPIAQVSWNDCKRFCDTVRLLDLPTEAQWEYACRARTTTTFAFGETLTREQATFTLDPENFNAEDVTEPSPVDSGAPNGFGLHNMHGNVFEWCHDAWDPNFYESPGALESDPANVPRETGAGTASETSRRVLRGGDFTDEAAGCRCARRHSDLPDQREDQIGFRPVWSVY